MIDLSGRLVRDKIRYVIPNSWVDKDLFRVSANELYVIHSLCVINLDSGGETVSSIIGALCGGLLYYHTSKVAYAINVSHEIVTPITLIDGDSLRVQLYASAADTPVAVVYQGMVYPIHKEKTE